MQRYKLIAEAVLTGVESVPWLTKHEKRSGGRSKVPKATVVVQGLKDVLRFWEDIWKGGAVPERPQLELEEDEDSGAWSGDEAESVGASSTGSEGSARSLSSVDSAATSRKRKRGSRKVTQASQYLLNPLSTSVPPLPGSSGAGIASNARATLGVPDTFSPAHLLTAHVSSLSAAPTRLQILAIERGGEEDVGDEELFEDGELEGFMRTEEEVEVARRMIIDSDDEDGDQCGAEDVRKKRRADGEVQGTKRIDMERLNALLADSGEETPSYGEAGVEEVSEWRPMSPEVGGFGGDIDVGDRYDF